MEISLPAARALLLHAQGMLTPVRRTAQKRDVLASIRRMGLLQIDTIHVIARSPYLVLYSRLGAYEPRWLDELHAAGKLFEYWAHAACFLPAENWPLYRGLMLDGMRERSRYFPHVLDWLEQNHEAAELVLRHILERGALRISDFEQEPEAVRPSGGWWDWKLEKTALEHLFYTGELVIARRERFQRVYDLRERIMPDWDDARATPANQARLALLRKAALALGVATEPWLRDYFRMNNAKCKQALSALLDSGELLPLRIDGVKEQAYVHRDALPVLKRLTGGRASLPAPNPDDAGKAERPETAALHASRTALLSPFDPLVWDRKRARELFGFDYTIEVYTPEHKRRYGYFTLPILHRGTLIGRLDPKAHRADAVFEVRALHLEPGVKLQAEDIGDIATAIHNMAQWHNTPQVIITRSDPPALAKKLQAALKRL
jgi:uncharacterized protein